MNQFTEVLAFLFPAPEIQDLENELQEVIDWIPFGFCLGIKMPELKTIETNHPNQLKRCRIEMLEEWQKKVTPTWSAVVLALVGIGMTRLASELAQKHGWFHNSFIIHFMNNLMYYLDIQYLSTQGFLLPSFQKMTLLSSWISLFSMTRG